MPVLDEEREKNHCELWSYITIWKILCIPDSLQWVPRETCCSYKLKCFGTFPGNNLSSLGESLYLLGLDYSVGSLKNILVPPSDCNSLHLSQLEPHTTFKKKSVQYWLKIDDEGNFHDQFSATVLEKKKCRQLSCLFKHY